MLVTGTEPVIDALVEAIGVAGVLQWLDDYEVEQYAKREYGLIRDPLDE